jgi:plasmid stability protein
MAQLVVRRLPESVKKRLKARATRHGRSLEGEVREILSRSVKEDAGNKRAATKGFGTRLAEIFEGKVPPEFNIEELRGEWIKPADFGK